MGYNIYDFGYYFLKYKLWMIQVPSNRCGFSRHDQKGPHANPRKFTSKNSTIKSIFLWCRNIQLSKLHFIILLLNTQFSTFRGGQSYKKILEAITLKTNLKNQALLRKCFQTLEKRSWILIVCLLKR